MPTRTAGRRHCVSTGGNGVGTNADKVSKFKIDRGEQWPLSLGHGPWGTIVYLVGL